MNLTRSARISSSQLAYCEVQAIVSEEALPLFKAHVEARHLGKSPRNRNASVSSERSHGNKSGRRRRSSSGSSSSWLSSLSILASASGKSSIPEDRESSVREGPTPDAQAPASMA